MPKAVARVSVPLRADGGLVDRLMQNLCVSETYPDRSEVVKGSLNVDIHHSPFKDENEKTDFAVTLLKRSSVGLVVCSSAVM